MLKGIDVPIPIVLMGYYNTAHRRGLISYAHELKAAGASGTIMCDLIPEEGDDWIAASQSAGLDTIFLAAPTSTPDRLTEVARVATGFLYAVSRTGVTGAQTVTSSDARGLVETLKGLTEVPVCVGFGISTPEQVQEVAAYADGAVVGSWLVDLLAREWQGGAGAQEIGSKVAALKAATRG
jgi:tryptophan synthase alpha chain